MEEARSRVELAIIKSDHRAHAVTCVASEGNRQNDVALAIFAGGGSATIAAVVRTAEIAHYRRIIASCLANGCPRRTSPRRCAILERAAVDERSHGRGESAGTSRRSNPDCLAIPENRPRFVLTNRSGATRSADDGVVVTGPRDDARGKLCGAGFVFSRSGDLCLFGGFRRNQSRVGGRCGVSVAA